jgi:hypothetical protein
MQHILLPAYLLFDGERLFLSHYIHKKVPAPPINKINKINEKSIFTKK